MTEQIKIDIPQLIVLPQDNYNGISKKFIGYLNDNFLWSYLSQKFSDYSVRHAIMNAQIREIFFMHHASIDSRMGEEMYSLDGKHYSLLFLSGQVSKGISCIAVELLYTMYFMKHLQTEKQFAEKIELSQAIQFVLQHQQLKDYFQKFAGFIYQVEDTRFSFDLNVVRPQHDYLMEENEPVYFVTRRNGDLIKYSLRSFIEVHNLFFRATKEVLQIHSPSAIAIGLQRWKD